MSAAGFERVNVTQRKFRADPGGELAVVDDHDQRERRRSGRSPRTTGRTRREVVSPSRRADRPAPGRPGCRAGRPAGRAKPSGRRRSGGDLGRQRPALRAGGGDHDLRALVEAVARVVERVDRRPGLEVEVGRPVDPLQDVAEEAPGCRGCRGPGRPPWRRSGGTWPATSAPGRGSRWPRSGSPAGVGPSA